jgi:hypothetical protein
MHEQQSYLKLLVEDGFMKHDWLVKTKQHFGDGPRFKAIRTTEFTRSKVYLKPPSRSTGWRVAICNGIQPTLKKYGTVTQEWCFVTPSVRDHVSELGDSGSMILDDQYRPAAMLWRGIGVANGVLPDVTCYSSSSCP